MAVVVQIGTVENIFGSDSAAITETCIDSRELHLALKFYF